MLSQVQPYALSARMSAQPLPTNTSSGAVLRLVLQPTGGTANGFAGFGVTVPWSSAAPQSSTRAVQPANSGPVPFHAATMSASTVAVKPSAHASVWLAGRGSGMPTHPCVAYACASASQNRQAVLPPARVTAGSVK
jgi:hypothetical protein